MLVAFRRLVNGGADSRGERQELREGFGWRELGGCEAGGRGIDHTQQTYSLLGA